MLKFLKDIFHFIEAILSEIYFGFPSRKIKIIGITGTDGKTTTSYFIYQILKKAGYNPSLLTSISAIIGGKNIDTGFHVTTPRPFIVRKMLALAVLKKSTHMILEVTSHALDQNRVAYIPFCVSVVTNITQDHLYHHKTLDNYIAIKLRLAKMSDAFFVNKHTQSYATIKKYLHTWNIKYKTYSLYKDDKPDYVWKYNQKTNISENFNKENALAAVCICKFLSVDEKIIDKALRKMLLPKGRVDMVYTTPFKIIVDFAHTPNAIDNILSYCKKSLCIKESKLIHIFGAASQRDDSKRSLMGESSSKYAHYIILTEEDYRKESIKKIYSEIQQGIHHKFRYLDNTHFLSDTKDYSYTTVDNRFDAILLGIRKAKKNDVVVITGKSHEKSLNRNGIEYDWDEYQAVTNALKFKKHI